MPPSQGKLVLGYRGHTELSLREKPRESMVPHRQEHSTDRGVPTNSRDRRCRPGRCGGWSEGRWARSRQGGMAHLVCFKGLLVGEEQLIPHHLHALLRVHGEEGALDAWHVPLIHLRGTARCETARLQPCPQLPAPPAALRGGTCCVDGLCYRSRGGLQPAGGSGQDTANPQTAACPALPSGPACLGARASQPPAPFLQDVRAQGTASDSERFPWQPLSTLLAQ